MTTNITPAEIGIAVVFLLALLAMRLGGDSKVSLGRGIVTIVFVALVLLVLLNALVHVM